jgi:hypothetical protein
MRQHQRERIDLKFDRSKRHFGPGCSGEAHDPKRHSTTSIFEGD